MKGARCVLLIAAILAADGATAQNKATDLDVVAPDGAKLRATYYSPGRPGPGLLLLHQCDMDRKSWSNLAAALAQRGIHVLALDYRGYGESAPTSGSENRSADVDAAFATLASRPGVDKDRLAAGGASCGVNNSVQLARRSGRIKALLLLSGHTTPEGLAFLREHANIAIFGAASSEEAHAVSSIKAMVASSTHAATTMQVLNDAGHGVPMFDADPKLLPRVVDWLEKVLR
jgi:dienelactone hydrolase